MYKVRPVAKDFIQQYDHDYDETFSLAIKIGTVHIVIAWTWMSLSQLDVKNTFLYIDLKKQVYMKQPPGYTEQNAMQRVLSAMKVSMGLNEHLGLTIFYLKFSNKDFLRVLLTISFSFTIVIKK